MGIETLLLIARAVVAVLFGHAIYALREEYGESTITVHEAHELEQHIDELSSKLVRVQQDFHHQLSSELASVRERVQQCEAATEAREAGNTRQRGHPKYLVRQKRVPQQATLRHTPESFH